MTTEDLLPRYSERAVCAKCHYGIASTQYAHINAHGHQPVAARMRNLGITEWLTRQCARCGFVWEELPLDAE